MKSDPGIPRSRNLAKGIRHGLPVLMGYLPIALAFGVIALAAAASHLQLVHFRLVPAGWGIILAIVAGSVFGILIFDAEGDSDRAAAVDGREEPR